MILHPGDKVLSREGIVLTAQHQIRSSGVWLFEEGQRLEERQLDEHFVRLTPEIGRAVFHLLYLGAITMPRELPAND